MLEPGGVFANLEVVASATERLHRQFLEAIGRTADDPGAVQHDGDVADDAAVAGLAGADPAGGDRGEQGGAALGDEVARQEGVRQVGRPDDLGRCQRQDGGQGERWSAETRPAPGRRRNP